MQILRDMVRIFDVSYIEIEIKGNIHYIHSLTLTGKTKSNNHNISVL